MYTAVPAWHVRGDLYLCSTYKMVHSAHSWLLWDKGCLLLQCVLGLSICKNRDRRLPLLHSI